MFTLSSMEPAPRAAFSFPNLDMKDVFRPCDPPGAPLIRPSMANRVAGEVDKAHKHYFMIEWFRRNARHAGSSTAPVDGAGGLPID